MDELRALAYLDLLLGRDSRPTPGTRARRTGSGHHEGHGTDEPGGRAAAPVRAARARPVRAARRRPGRAAAVRVRVRVAA